MGQLVFDEEALINGNIFKYEERLLSHTNKYIENGAILTTYWNISENATTVDRGSQSIDELFGKKSPLRFNKILNFPLYGFDQANPNNTDESQIEDINIEGDCIILPSTITPHPNDVFTLNHLKMTGIFQVIEVQYDSMKVEGFYKIRYRLHNTSEENLNNLEMQTVETYKTDLNAIGSNVNPIIQVDDFTRRRKIEQMVAKMIHSYKALFYNDRHNCFLFHEQNIGVKLFDLCGNEFMAKHSIMNGPNSNSVVILHDKINEPYFPLYYNNSIFNWIELDAPKRLLQKFFYRINPGVGYKDSSFARWNDDDIFVIQPLGLTQIGTYNQEYSYLDGIQLEGFEQIKVEPTSEYEKLIWKFINKRDSISINDISLYTADALLSSIKAIDIFNYTPILIYIIRKILQMN